MSFSADGKYVATGSEDGTVNIWEVETVKCIDSPRSLWPNKELKFFSLQEACCINSLWRVHSEDLESGNF